MPQRTITLDFPVLIYANDYHAFMDYHDVLKQFMPKIKVSELGMVGDEYCAAAYFTKREFEQAKKMWNALIPQEDE